MNSFSPSIQNQTDRARGQYLTMALQELPRAEFILSSLENLANSHSETVGALLIAITSTRLTEAGCTQRIQYPELSSRRWLSLRSQKRQRRSMGLKIWLRRRSSSEVPIPMIISPAHSIVSALGPTIRLWSARRIAKIKAPDLSRSSA